MSGVEERFGICQEGRQRGPHRQRTLVLPDKVHAAVPISGNHLQQFLRAADLGQLAIGHHHGQATAALRAARLQGTDRLTAKPLDHRLGDAAGMLDQHPGSPFTVPNGYSRHIVH